MKHFGELEGSEFTNGTEFNKEKEKVMESSHASMGTETERLEEEQSLGDGGTCSIRETWLNDLKEGINPKYYKPKFDQQIVRLLDEVQETKGEGIYNTSKKLLAKRSLAHLNSPAKPGDEYDPTLMTKIVNAYQRYHMMMQVFDRHYFDPSGRNLGGEHILSSVPLLTFIMRDSLTGESNRNIQDDPVIAAYKLESVILRVVGKLESKVDCLVGDAIGYIRKIMAAKLTRTMVQRCHDFFPAEAERLGLPKAERREELENEEPFELVTGLEELNPDLIDPNSFEHMGGIMDRMRSLESRIDDHHVFRSDSIEGIGEAYFLYVNENGKYYKKRVRDSINFYETEGPTPLEDEETLAAILDTGIIPIPILESDIHEYATGFDRDFDL